MHLTEKKKKRMCQWKNSMQVNFSQLHRLSDNFVIAWLFLECKRQKIKINSAFKLWGSFICMKC